MRRPLRRLRRLLLCSCLGASAPLSSCATTASTSPAAASSAREFAPLAVGNVWSYRVVPGPDAPHTLTIVSFDKGYFVDDRGGRMAPRTDGLFDGERFLLQDPLVVGREWIAKSRTQGVEHYRVAQTDASVTVPAGTYSGCVVVEGEQPTRDPGTGQPATLLMTWTWARGVGLVRVEQRVRRGEAAPFVTAQMELLSFTPAGSSSSSSSSSSGAAQP